MVYIINMFPDRRVRIGKLVALWAKVATLVIVVLNYFFAAIPRNLIMVSFVAAVVLSLVGDASILYLDSSSKKEKWERILWIVVAIALLILFVPPLVFYWDSRY